jgi:hypothetical protein
MSKKIINTKNQMEAASEVNTTETVSNTNPTETVSNTNPTETVSNASPIETASKTVNLTSLFSNGSHTAASSAANQLQQTATLTNIATQVANAILTIVELDVEKYQLKVTESQKSHDAMDALITECYDLSKVDVDFLKDVSSDDIDKMIRSQQSKRSRAKSKVMTMDNYKAMLTGAISENLLRIAANKPKSAGGSGNYTSEIGYSEDEIKKLSEDQEALKKAIRNVQSKKSIMKAKAEFDEKSERWQQLLAAEATLKSLRDDSNVTVVTNPEAEKALETKTKVEEMLASADVDNLKGADAKSMLEKIKEMLAGK